MARKLFGWFIVGCILIVSSKTVVGVIVLKEDFDEWSQLVIPVTPGYDSSSWYTDAAGNYGISWLYSSSPHLWNSGGQAKYANVWLNVGDMVSPVLQGTMWNGTGLDTDTTLWSYLWLKDADNNGYMGRINRAGGMEIYRVTGGNVSFLAANNGSQVPDGDKKIMKLSVTGGVVTLSFQYPGDVRLYRVSAGDNTYTSFTLIGLGGQYSWGESHSIDDVILFANPLTGTNLSYSQSYDSWSNGAYLTTTGSSDSDYWFCDVAGNYFASNSYWPTCRLWNSGESPRARDANCWRNFRTSGELAAGSVIVNPVLQATMANGAGSNDDSSMWSRMWLKDDNGNGYMGRINRTGQMEIYRIDKGGMVQIGTSDESQVPNGDTKAMKFSVAYGEVTLSFQYSGQSQVYSLSVADTSYTGFVMIGLGGQYGWSESHTIDDVVLGGVVASSPDETVTVDFSVNKGTATWRESGFLSGFSTTEPLDDLITPLKVSTIRCHPSNWAPAGHGLDGAFDIYDRAGNLGINKIQCCISDNYGYAAPWPGDNGDWTAWENTVRDVVTRARNEGKVFYWDIWNEPNGNGQVIFGKQAPAVGWQQFLETWKRAVQIIRSINPSEIIVGPSLAGLAPDYQYMASFLTYARDNNVLPDIVSWHDHYDIVNHVNWVRQTMVLMGISARPISINEYTDQLVYTNPGYLVKTIAQLEDADVDSASHTHWGDFYSTDLWVTDHSMDAVLKPGTFEKRPPWWVYKGYADIAGSFAAVSGTMLGTYNVPIVYGLAGYDETDNTARVLLGKSEGSDSSGTTVLLTHLSSLSNLAASGRVRITAERIPYKGWEPLAAPEDLLDSIYTITDDQVRVVIPNLQNSDACTLKATLSSLAFSDGFENGLSSGGWQSSGCDVTTSQKYSGSGSVLLNNSDSLTKSFSTVNLKNIQIRYVRLIRYFISWNNTFVAEWSSDGGTTWTTLESLTGSSGWTLRAYDLPASAENNANFKIRFRVTQGTLPVGESYVDDVRIVGDPISEQTASLPGDANGDGAVNVSDLSLLAANYGTTRGATWAMGDFTGDGAVNVSDLSLLAANYGTGSSDTLSWADAYAQAFGSTSDAEDASNNDASEGSEGTSRAVCSSLGLSLIAGLALMGLMIVKMKE